MCSIDSEEMPEFVEILSLPISDMCRKCGKDGANIILRTKDFYCNSCFLVYFVHKFRSTIGKSREIKHGDKILIPFYASKSTYALLHLIRQGLDEDSHKKLRFEPTILFIDDGIIHTSETLLEVIFNEFDRLNFPWFYVRFQDVMKEDSINPVKYEQVSSPIDSLKNGEEFVSLLSAIKCQTDKDDYILHLLLKLICVSASKLNFQKVFLADNSTDISVRILSHIALGRGSQIPDHVGFKSIHMGTYIYRPMREILQDEIEHFIRLNDIPVHSKFNTCNVHSIQSCTQNFISGLQKEFKSTIPTVLKIGDKVQTVNCDVESSSIISGKSVSKTGSSIDSYGTISSFSLCAVCGFRIDTDKGNTSAIFSQVVGKEMSVKQPPNVLSNSLNDELTNAVDMSKPVIETSLSQNDEQFCYGCRHITKNLPSLDILPEDARHKIEECSNHIRQKIEEFIL